MLEYGKFALALQRIEGEQGTAELHGQMIGLLCIRQTMQFNDWLAEAMPELLAAINSGDALAKESAATIEQAFKQALTTLSEGQLDFQLLLPDDETPLPDRISELSEWCQGFLLGLTMAGITEYQHLPGDLPDLMNDMVEISRAEAYDLQDEDEDDDETAYIELSEYVRLGVMNVWEEIRQLYAARGEGESLH